jgi:hypothetical protein
MVQDSLLRIISTRLPIASPWTSGVPASSKRIPRCMLPNISLGEGRDLRQLSTKKSKGCNSLSVHLYSPTGVEKVIILHRLFHTVAKAHGMSIYSEGPLKTVGVLLPQGQTFEQVYGYIYMNHDEKENIKETMCACSLQCYADHFIGRNERYADGTLFSGACSHWLNSCRVHCDSLVSSSS